MNRSKVENEITVLHLVSDVLGGLCRAFRIREIHLHVLYYKPSNCLNLRPTSYRVQCIIR